MHAGYVHVYQHYPLSHLVTRPKQLGGLCSDDQPFFLRGELRGEGRAPEIPATKAAKSNQRARKHIPGIIVLVLLYAVCAITLLVPTELLSHVCYEISGVLVRLTTCKRLTSVAYPN